MQNRDCNSELPVMMDEISANPFAVDFAVLTEKMCMGKRSFQSLFWQHTGLTPRDFIGITKIDKVLDMMKLHKECSLVEILEMSGYYDYAHINRDFKIIGGLPTALVFKNIRDHLSKTSIPFCVNYPRDGICAVNLMV